MSVFACIFFKEDNSLSVVNKNDKNLTLDSTFETKNKVKMTWRKGAKKELYHGTIIKVGDDEDALLRFAKAVNKRVVEIQANRNEEEVLEELIAFRERGCGGGKRQRVQTEISKISAEQDAEFSPRKKKIRKPAAKKEQKSVALVTGQLMFDQFYSKAMEMPANTSATATTTSTLDKGVKLANSSEMLKIPHTADETSMIPSTALDKTVLATSLDTTLDKNTVPRNSAPELTASAVCTSDRTFFVATSAYTDDLMLATSATSQETTLLTTSATLDKMICKTAVKVAPAVSTSLSSPLPSNTGNVVPVETLDMSVSDVNRHHETTDISLTRTWKTCRDAIAVVRSDSQCQIPIPSNEVLHTLQGICNPEFIEFIGSIAEHLQSNSCSHTCFQQWFQQTQSPVYMDLSTPNTQLEEQNSYEDTSFSSLMNTTSSLPKATSTPHAASGCTGATSTPHHHSPKQSSCLSTGIPVRRSPRKHVQRAIEKNFVSSKTASDSPAAGTSKDNHVTVMDNTVTGGSNDSDLVYLLSDKNRKTKVNRSAKNKAISAAKQKKGKEGYVLMYRLVGEVFSLAELAQSGGTGAAKHKAAASNQPTLDQEKIRDLKDYVTIFCRTNNYTEPTDPMYNKAINERIGYARKQLKK